MPPHAHREYVPGCPRCELGRDEARDAMYDDGVPLERVRDALSELDEAHREYTHAVLIGSMIVDRYRKQLHATRERLIKEFGDIPSPAAAEASERTTDSSGEDS